MSEGMLFGDGIFASLGDPLWYCLPHGDWFPYGLALRCRFCRLMALGCPIKDLFMTLSCLPLSLFVCSVPSKKGILQTIEKCGILIKESYSDDGLLCLSQATYACN